MALHFIRHDLAAVARATSEIAVMYGGDIVERGPTRAVLDSPAHPYTRGLLGARPSATSLPRDANGKRARLPTIPGTVPGMAELPKVCRFAGRCPVELPHCASERPALTKPGPDRSAICHVLSQEVSA